jgi:hypothetical protein
LPISTERVGELGDVCGDCRHTAVANQGTESEIRLRDVDRGTARRAI